MPARVGELMHRGLVTCARDTSLGDAAALLVRNRVHALVVEDGGRAVGILADFDLLAGEWLSTDADRLATLRAMRAEELMTAPPLTIDAGATAAEAAALLLGERVARLLVVEDGAPAGVVSVSDLVAALDGAGPARETVADVMSRAFVACRPETPVPALARAMSERRSRSVVVLGADGRALGVVTGTDLLPLLDGSGEAETAADLMHEPYTIGPEAPLHEAAAQMVEREVHRLVVVDAGNRDGPPLGVVSTWDVLAEMASAGSAWR